MTEQTTRSAWPDPPNYYKRYTDENLRLLKEAKETQEFPMDPITSPSIPEFYIQSLEPPAAPASEYTVFDQKWQIEDQLPTLNELGLLDTLVKDPEEFGKYIENISTTFINMHHILNAYRPHQARETLRLLMEDQIAKKRQQTQEIRE
ncbi:hypothetical protein G6F62_006488 [Rhizopus arrhizus]|nr:hypothetical protein G6F22_005908 [Rhizopus arrhizus]KAG1218811.1 hypothetical protein G6F35_008024 [Rhizopus arrhizus]KAG1335846.1 hypothetical protein G6F62_006488 [Rhizopus arrhizus]